MSIQKYPREQIRAQVPVSAADGNSDHVWNGRQLLEKPSLLYVGSQGFLPADWVNDHGLGIYQRTNQSFLSSYGSYDRIFSGSIMVPPKREGSVVGTSIEVNLLVIGLNLVTIFLPTSFEDVQDGAARAATDIRCTLTQLTPGSEDWSDASNHTQSAEITSTLTFWPLETAGVSRYLRSSQLQYDHFDDGGLEEDASNFIYREGHLWSEDFALVTWVQLTIEDLDDDFFDPSVPIRFDIEQQIENSSDVTWFNPSDAGDATDLGLGVVGSSIYAHSYIR